VQAGQLRAGERLAGELGTILVAAVSHDSQPTSVFNLDVESDHRYLVTDLGILAHNVDESCDARRAYRNMLENPDAERRRLRQSMVKELGEEAMIDKEAHHGIPVQLVEDPEVRGIIERAARGGFNLSGGENGVAAPWNHGSHPDYTTEIKDLIKLNSARAGTPQGARGVLDSIVTHVRENLGDFFDLE
jgi:hypothetical protein